MYVLYGGKLARSLMVEMVLDEVGAEYRVENTDMFKNEHRSEAFLQVNPAGWIPALVTPEGEALHETQAINLYLCERHEAIHLVPPVSDPLRGRFLSALFYISGELEPAIKRYFFAHRYGFGQEGARIFAGKQGHYHTKGDGQRRIVAPIRRSLF